ncbi:unnamed protein product, partial [Protopolystoma xenopodis]
MLLSLSFSLSLSLSLSISRTQDACFHLAFTLTFTPSTYPPISPPIGYKLDSRPSPSPRPGGVWRGVAWRGVAWRGESPTGRSFVVPAHGHACLSVCLCVYARRRLGSAQLSSAQLCSAHPSSARHRPAVQPSSRPAAQPVCSKVEEVVSGRPEKSESGRGSVSSDAVSAHELCAHSSQSERAGIRRNPLRQTHKPRAPCPVPRRPQQATQASTRLDRPRAASLPRELSRLPTLRLSRSSLSLIFVSITSPAHARRPRTPTSCVLASPTAPHRIAPHRTASHRIAPHRTASHR